MSVKVMSRVWENSGEKGNRLLALLAIADNANDDGWAYPSHETLAKKCRVGRRAIQKILDGLEYDGELTIYNRVSNADPMQHFSNVYHLPRYGNPAAQPPVELRGKLRMRVSSEQRFTRVANGETLPPSEQRFTRVANGGSHESSQEPSPSKPSEREKAPSLSIRKTYPVKVYGGQDTYADGKFIDPVSKDFETACNAIFYAYVDALDAVGRKPDTHLDEVWSANYTAITALAKHRRTPEQVAALVTYVYSKEADDFYKKLLVPIKLQAVANALPAFLSQQAQPARTQASPVHVAPDTAPALTAEEKAAMIAEGRAALRRTRKPEVAYGS